MTEHNNPAGEATEIERLSKLAEANGQQARFWANHFAEVEKANRDALSAHHKPGHTVAELITAVVGELDNLRASREAWAIEADRLDVIATAARYYTGPGDCLDSECDHLYDDEGNFIGSDEDGCPHVKTQYATAEDAIAAGNVTWLEAERERLLTLCAKGNDFVLDVADALGVPASTSNDDLIAALASRPAIPVDAEEGAFGQRCEELGRIPAGRYYLTSGVEVGDNREVVSRFDIPGGVRIAGFWPSHKARIEPAPVSGSDTTADGGV